MTNTKHIINMETLTKKYLTKKDKLVCGYHRGLKKWILHVSGVGFLPGYPPN